MDSHEKEQARARRRARWAAAAARLRPVVPLLLVNIVAVGGQLAYGLDAYRVDGWPWAATLATALVAALTAESISLYVNWHAHDALLLNATSTAARRRAQAYLIAAVVAAINYSHFSAGWAPTPAAVLTAGCSLLSPWLWGLHTRRAQRVQLLREGHADITGATFAAARWRWFPRYTLGARRWSIFHGERDPQVAWARYITERDAAATACAEQAAVKTAQTPTEVPAQAAQQEKSKPAPRRAATPRPAAPTDDQYIAAVHAWATEHRQAITNRRQLQHAAHEALGVKPGSTRAEHLLGLYLAAHPHLTVAGGAQ